MSLLHCRARCWPEAAEAGRAEHVRCPSISDIDLFRHRCGIIGLAVPMKRRPASSMWSAMAPWSRSSRRSTTTLAGARQLLDASHPVARHPGTLATDGLGLGILTGQQQRTRRPALAPPIPSAGYSCSGSLLILLNGSTAIDARSGRASGPLASHGPISAESLWSRHRTAPIKRMPLRGNLITRCSSPLSPIAPRAALMQVASADSETMRPFQTATMRSSRLTNPTNKPVPVVPRMSPLHRAILEKS